MDEIGARRKAMIAQQEALDAQREADRQELIAAKKQEANMLKAARNDVLAALVLAADLVSAMRVAVEAIKDSLKSTKGPDGKDIPPKIAPLVAMQILTRHATLVQKAVGAAEAVIQLSRLDRGETTVNVGVGMPVEGLSAEQIDKELEAIAEVLGSHKQAQAGAAIGLLPARQDGQPRGAHNGGTHTRRMPAPDMEDEP